MKTIALEKHDKVIKKIFYAIIVFGVLYVLQYVSTAVYYNCTVLKDDCPPPIFAPSAFIYRVVVHPFWLDAFTIHPTEFSFAGGTYTFWEGIVEGNPVVIRVPKNGSPVMQWIDMGLPLGVPLRPAQGDTLLKWIASHPEISLTPAVE